MNRIYIMLLLFSTMFFFMATTFTEGTGFSKGRLFFIGIIEQDKNQELPFVVKKMQETMQEIADSTNLQLKDTLLFKGNFKEQELKNYLDHLGTTFNDVIFVHYIGAGLNHNGENNRFPLFTIPDNGVGITQIDLHTYLSKQNPRLLVTMFDCNNSVPNQQSHNIYTEDTTELKHNVATRVMYESLFLKSSGSVIICAASRGESAIVSNSIGNIFSMSFLRALNNGHIIWQTLLEETKMLTFKEAQLMSDANIRGGASPNQCGKYSQLPDYLNNTQIIEDNLGVETSVNNTEIEIGFADSGGEADGDMIAVKINGKCVAEKILLTTAVQKIKVSLCSSAKNELEIINLNEGNEATNIKDVYLYDKSGNEITMFYRLKGMKGQSNFITINCKAAKAVTPLFPFDFSSGGVRQ